MMLRHLDVYALRLNYIDTDSMVMSLSKSLDEMVLPGAERSWLHHKKKWFVLNETQLREPGTYHFLLSMRY